MQSPTCAVSVCYLDLLSYYVILLYALFYASEDLLQDLTVCIYR